MTQPRESAAGIVRTEIPSLSSASPFYVESIIDPERFRDERLWFRVLDINGAEIMRFAHDARQGMVAIPGVPVRPREAEGLSWERNDETGLFDYLIDG